MGANIKKTLYNCHNVEKKASVIGMI